MDIYYAPCNFCGQLNDSDYYYIDSRKWWICDDCAIFLNVYQDNHFIINKKTIRRYEAL